MGRHAAATTERRWPVGLAVVAGSVATFFAVGADVGAQRIEAVAAPAVPVVASRPCCVQVVEAVHPLAPSVGPFEAEMGGDALMSASRWRVDDRPPVLPVGVAPETGLQVKTILVSREISVIFPEIQSIGGVRPDALRWHPDGLALDVMIPNPSSPAGIELGNEIVAFVLKNASRFGIQDAIWRGTYWTPAGPQYGGMAHFDHVHITTLGGGYPSGDEVYYR